MCPVCLTLPMGEVHQCNKGHCYCVGCWNRLDPRCPECRQPIQDSNRNRDREARIAALEAACDHCAEPTTRGTKAAHMLMCPRRPTACAGATVGCGWSGVAAEQAAHEAACPIAVCQRMMAPMQARCDGLQARCEGLQVQNQQLQQRVAALEPLADRTRALEGDAEAGRRRSGPAPHDVPPSDAAIAEMGLAEMVAALLAHLSVARVAAKACGRLTRMCDPADNKHAGAEAGVIEAVIAAMRAHTLDSSVQVHGCAALYSVCGGTSDAASRARRQRATQAGGRTAVAAARQAHPADGPVKTVCTVLLRVLPTDVFPPMFFPPIMWV